jgi:4-amino-4-deoxy-L-arabinose transferase-like glycosyltransferase
MNTESPSVSIRKIFFSIPGSPQQIILIAAWALMQAVILYTYGIVTVNEARKYIEQADLFSQTGAVSSPNMWMYSVQIFFIAAAKQLGTGYISVIMVQLLFNALATFSLYRLFEKLSNKKTAFIGTLLFILNYPLHTFNTFLYTESLFFSFTILLSCFILRLEKLSTSSLLKILLFLLLICFTRPSGLLFVPCVSLYLFFRFFKSYPLLLKAAAAVVVSIVFLFILNRALGSGGELDFLLPFREEHIICGVPTVTNAAQGTHNNNSLWGIMLYIFDHPEQFARLAWLRTKAFFGLYRSYYSTGHNIYLVVYFFSLYLMVIISFREWVIKNKWLLMYCIAAILITWATAIFTCDDWHNRFFLSIAPYIHILCVPVLEKLAGFFNGEKK